MCNRRPREKISFCMIAEMANFAKEQLMKYGWAEGKGLGKNENGITEPVKLATCQNRTGIGYDEYKSWWESLYDNAVKNVKVKSHNDEVSLTVVNNAGALYPENERRNSRETSVRLNYLQTFVNDKDSMLMKTCVHVTDQKLDGVYCNKTMHESMKQNITLSGKLERIAEQDKLFLNTNSLLSATLFKPVRENYMAHRKTNVESDVEESEYKVNNTHILQSVVEARDLVSKSRRLKSKKSNKKRKKKLAPDTFNLEENNQKQYFLYNRKSCQKMKKNKEEKKNLNVLSNYIQNEFRMNDFQILNNKIQKKKNQRYRSKQIKKVAEKLKGEAMANELNSIIKNLMTFDLTEEVNVNIVKKKFIPIQTHFTPV